MNKFFNYIAFAAVFNLSFTQCSDQKKTYSLTPTTIEGKINNPSVPSIFFGSIDRKEFSLDQNAAFKIETQLDKSGVYYLEYGNQRLNIFVEPGDKISVVIDGNNPTYSGVFSGSHANENNYLVHYENFKAGSEPKDFQTFYSRPEAEFLKSVDDRKQSFVVDQQKFQQDNGTFDEAFADIVSSELAYDAATLKLYYPQYYKYFNPDIPLELSDNFESFFQNLDVNSEDNLLVPSYKNFVGMYLYFKTNNEKSETDVHPSIRAFDNVEKLFMSPAIREYLYYSIMKSNLEESINVTAELMSKYQEVQKNPEFFQEINNAYQQWSHLVKGNKSPSFNYPTIRNQKVSLESLAGKVVYIDVWATWCGPCLKELPHLEALQEKFKKSDKIAFVSISVDQDKAAWEIMVTQKNMKGIQLFADGNWASSIVQDFKINGIPRFIIIGKDGNIIDAKAIRPSAPEISQLLEKSIAE